MNWVGEKLKSEINDSKVRLDRKHLSPGGLGLIYRYLRAFASRLSTTLGKRHRRSSRNQHTHVLKRMFRCLGRYLHLSPTLQWNFYSFISISGPYMVYVGFALDSGRKSTMVSSLGLSPSLKYAKKLELKQASYYVNGNLFACGRTWAKFACSTLKQIPSF